MNIVIHIPDSIKQIADEDNIEAFAHIERLKTLMKAIRDSKSYDDIVFDTKDGLISRNQLLRTLRDEFCNDEDCFAHRRGKCTETCCQFKFVEIAIREMPSVRKAEDLEEE